VLHRDIKPGNIIVGEHGETLVVDWGLAKATGQSDPASTERILVPSSASGSAETLPGSALGTPAYMSPEQAGGDLEALGPRSDVYGLGATLYCLLTGRPPFAGQTGEVLRAVQRGSFPPPRAIEPSIDPALEAVCLKAMAFRPEDRYARCRALTDDIERWMADEPVSAWREPISRRIRRWMQRNRTAVAAVLVALVAGIVGLGAVTGVQARANGKLRNANELTHREAQRADDNALLINGALGRLVQRVGADKRLQAAGLTAFREELLRDAVGMYDDLVRRNPGEGTLGLGQALNNQALIQYHLGDFPRAIATQIRGETLLAALPPSYESRRAVADARKQLGVLYAFNGQAAQGLPKAREAVEMYQALIKERPGDQDTRYQLALATGNLGNFAMASDPDAAIARYREALAQIEDLRREAPADSRFTAWAARTTSNLGLIQAATRKTDASVETQRQAVTLAEQVPDEFLKLDALAMCRNNLGEALDLAGRAADAEPIFRQTLEDYRSLTRRFPNNVDYRWGVAMSLTNLAGVVLKQGRAKEAGDVIEEASPIFEAVKPSLENNADFQDHYQKHRQIRDAIRKSLEANKR
jgi:serine/threonine-protein kinase